MSQLNLVSTPSIDQATYLAVTINATIIPEEEVSKVVEDADEAHGKAQELLSDAFITKLIINYYSKKS